MDNLAASKEYQSRVKNIFHALLLTDNPLEQLALLKNSDLILGKWRLLLINNISDAKQQGLGGN